MKIFLTNDDGISAPGLMELARCLAKKHSVSIIAPDRQRSAMSHSMTFTRPLIPQRAHGYEFIDGGAYMLNGTPVDCVKVAASAGLIDQGFELVVSGLNNGPNLGTDVLYSGTAAAALEGVIKGRRAIAFSLDCLHSHDMDSMSDNLSGAVQKAAELVDTIDFAGLPEGVALSVNFPDMPADKFKGVRVCPLGDIRYDDEMGVSHHARGFDYYWMLGTQRRISGTAMTDIDYIAQGYVTVTPLTYDLTAHAKLDGCRRALEGIGV